MEQVNEVERLKATNWELATQLNTAKNRIAELEEGQITQRKFNHEYAKLKSEKSRAEKRAYELQEQIDDLHKTLRKLLPPAPQQVEKDQITLKQEIHTGYFSIRLRNTLKHWGVKKYKDITALSKHEILRIPNFGHVSYLELKNHLLKKFGEDFCDRNFPQHFS